MSMTCKRRSGTSECVPRRPNRQRQIDFNNVGGLSSHLKTLRDTIIVPLLHGNVYTHFNVKTPRGVLFYGPPGTGKTLVAGALATELNKEGFGKVSFFQRKGADVLDKWVGESEKKLRTLFETATKNRPSIIFFDELDGLAPVRSTKDDHVHCSIVTTLLALMDGLDSVQGVIVIGATNRIESVDPALRRAGRFDRELYFPLPGTDARVEILQVHMQTWKQKPSREFVFKLAEMTPGFCGSDLQALCAEALLCAMKRLHPNIQQASQKPRIKIEAEEINIEESDFLTARAGLVSAADKMGHKMRKLSPVITPLLQKQLRVILSRMQMLWPHFFCQFHKYIIGSDRYVGRIVLLGSGVQGLNTHLIPAILQHFEHLPSTILDSTNIHNHTIIPTVCKNLPAILVIPRLDELWGFLDESQQNHFTSSLEDIHSGLPILIVATCEEDLPLLLQSFFFNNTSVVVNIDDPSEKEVGDFFFPLFFGDSPNFYSVSKIMTQNKLNNCKRDVLDGGAPKKKLTIPSHANMLFKIHPTGKITKTGAGKKKLKCLPEKKLLPVLIRQPINITTEVAAPSRSCTDLVEAIPKTHKGCDDALCNLCGTLHKKKPVTTILTDLLHRCQNYLWRKSPIKIVRLSSERNLTLLQKYSDSDEADKQAIYQLWHRAVTKTARNMHLAQLEVLYDTIYTCIAIHKDDFHNLIKGLEDTLIEVESNLK